MLLSVVAVADECHRFRFNSKPAKYDVSIAVITVYTYYYYYNLR